MINNDCVQTQNTYKERLQFSKKNRYFALGTHSEKE